MTSSPAITAQHAPHTRPDTAPRPRVLFLNRSYWPDAEATGQLLTELCEDLSGGFDVSVIAGQPNQNPQNVSFRRRGWQRHREVRIRRVWHSRFPKSSLVGRAINFITYLLAASLAALRAPRPAVVVVETDPPLLCLLGALLQWRHRCRLVVYLQDIYPDVAVAVGRLSDGWLAAWLRRLFLGVYRRADRVVVLSQDMRQLLVDAGVPCEKIEIIPNWVDTERIVPMKEDNAFRHRQDLEDKFVVMYSGNLGLCQRLDDVLDAAERLRDRDRIEFLLVGGGASRERLEQQARDRGLNNVRFLDYQAKSELAISLSAADLHLVPLDPRVTGCLMPSKLYGILASGTPLIAIAPPDCELAELTRVEDVGFVIAPGHTSALADIIGWCAEHPEQLAPLGRSARLLATDHYDRKDVTARFGSLLAGLLPPAPSIAAPFEPKTEPLLSASRMNNE